MKEQKKQNPPYLPVGVLEEFFQKIKVVNLPKTVDVNTFRAWGIAGKQEYFLRSALAFLGLIDEDGKPTSELEKLQIEGDQFKINLKGIIEEAYKDTFGALKIEHASHKDLVNFFGQKYSQVTKDRMVKCFRYLCNLAGIESPAFEDIETKVKRIISKPKPSGLLKSKIKTPKDEKPLLKSDRVLQLAKIMADAGWNADQMKVFFDNIDKIESKKTNEDENKETEG